MSFNCSCRNKIWYVSNELYVVCILINKCTLLIIRFYAIINVFLFILLVQNESQHKPPCSIDNVHYILYMMLTLLNNTFLRRMYC
jgi:hypothetical protein